MKDIVPKLTGEEIEQANMRDSVVLGAKYDLTAIPKGKAKAITQTEMYRHQYVTHNKHTLSFREARFIDAYMASGDLVDAVEKAGFTCKDKAGKGHALLKKDYIADEIGYRQELYSNALIADRQEILQFLTDVMRGNVKDQFNLDATLKDRLDATEKLAKRLIDDPAKAKQNIAAQQVVVNIDFNRDEEETPIVDVQQLSD